MKNVFFLHVSWCLSNAVFKTCLHTNVLRFASPPAWRPISASVLASSTLFTPQLGATLPLQRMWTFILQTVKSEKMKKEKKEGVNYICCADLKSDKFTSYFCSAAPVWLGPTAGNHSGHRMWATCSCGCWTCVGGWCWSLVFQAADRRQAVD